MIQELLPTRGYQSSVGYPLVFGLGTHTEVDGIKVKWPDGRVQQLEGVSADQALTIEQKHAKEEISIGPKPREAFFTNINSDSILTFVHRENNFIDFKREQLLPHMLSTLGPKLAVADVNKDGLEDIFIGGAKGSPGAIYLQSRSGKFKSSNIEVLAADAASEDLDALFFDADADGDLDLYVVSGGADFDLEDENLQDRLYFNNGFGVFTKDINALPKMNTSGSSITAGDIDEDGDMDLFIGGRLEPGHYPNAPRSYVLENNGQGTFTDVTSNSSTELVNPGMVTDALWTDFDGDHKLDLILIGEWMNIRVFKNSGNKLMDITETSGLSNTHGWWNAITAGDFDNDGDPDYVLGNFGHNSQLKASTKEPLTLFVKDFDGNGSQDPILCSYVMGESYPVFSKDDLVGQLNGLKSRYVNYADYAGQKITDIFEEDQLSDARRFSATELESSYLENLGNGKFKISALPNQAQFSPLYGLYVQDFNADGHPDILGAGNFFGTRVKYGRYDANKGVLLLGDGTGKFEFVNNSDSGLQLNGEVRDITPVTLADGTAYLLFTQNNAALQVYKINTK